MRTSLALALVQALGPSLVAPCAQEAGRPELAPLQGVGPIAPVEWKVLEPRPGPSSDTVTLKAREQGFVLADAIVRASSRTAFICYENGGPYVGTTLRNAILRVEPGTLPLDRSFWGVRGYDMVDTLFERVEITGFGRVTEKHDEGHAVYLNLAGAFTLLDSDVHHNGGQGLQLVVRPHESKLAPGPAAGAIRVERTRFRENGFNPDRGGFQVSIFGTGQHVRLEDVEIAAGLDDTVYPLGATGGALLIEAEAFDVRRGDPAVWWRPNEPPEGFQPPFAQGSVELVRLRVRHVAPNRPLVQIKGCAELVVRDSSFEGGRIELDLAEKPGRSSGRIVWQGNRGSAEVFLRGVRQGRADEDWVSE
jgi:hypothetical protein